MYYRVPRARVDAACAAVRAQQQAWTQRHAGLQAQLLLREENGASELATLMEVWLWADGSAPAPTPEPSWDRLEEALTGALGECLVGPRHVEDFGPAPLGLHAQPPC